MFLTRALALLLFAATLAFGQTALHPDVPAPFSHPPQSAPALFAGQNGFYIDVPENAIRLVIKMRAASGSPDVDLHVRYGQDVTLATRVQADISLTQAAEDRRIVLSRQTDPPLQPGRWFIATGVDSGFGFAAGLVEADYTVAQSLDGAPLEVPALGNIFLAGRGAGAFIGNDQAPINSPTLVPQAMTPGATVQIVASGVAHLSQTNNRLFNYTPEGGAFSNINSASFRGGNVSRLTARLGGLVGVFLGGEIADRTPLPLNYQSALIDVARLEPQLQQQFYIGNGTTPNGELRTFTVPAGATRLFLAVGEDGAASNNNSGSFTVIVSVVNNNRPAVTTAGLTNAAGFASRPLAAGSILSIFGENFGALASAETVPLPSELSATSVWFDTTPAPLYFVSPGQINAQIPWEFDMAREVLVTVVRDGNAGVPVKLQLEPFRPAIFDSSIGPIVINNRTGGLVSATDPARPGDALILFANGLGPVGPPVAAGAASPSSPLAVGTFTPQVLLQGGGSEVTVRPFFSGLAPNFAGVFQVNFVVPDNAPRGEVLLALQAPGFSRSDTVGFTIQ